MKTVLLGILSMLLVLAFAGCSNGGDESYYNVAAHEPNTFNTLVHFSQDSSNFCMAACSNMHEIYGGAPLVPQAVFMQQADVDYVDGLISLYEYTNWFNYYSTITMQTSVVRMITNNAQADCNNLSECIANMISFGVTPLFVFYNIHGILVGGYSHDAALNVTHIIVFDPAVPDTAREKAIMMKKWDFYRRVYAGYYDGVGWGYPFENQWAYMPPIPKEGSPDTTGFYDKCIPVDCSEDLNLVRLNRNHPYPPIYPMADGWSHTSQDYEDTVRCYADTALMEWVANSPQEAASRFGRWLCHPIHIGAVTATSRESWDPPEDGAAKTAGPALYMWVCEIESSYDNELLGAVLLYYYDIDSTLSIVACPPRSVPDKDGHSAALEPVRAEEIQAVYGNRPVPFVSMRYLGVLSSAPDLDLGVWQVVDSATGGLIHCDYYGQELDLDGDNMFYKTGRMLVSAPAGNRNHGTLPLDYILTQNYPNPFNPSTQFDFYLPKAGDVRLEVYNLTGQKVSTLTDEFMSAGMHTMTWDGTDMSGTKVASGVYFYRMTSGDFSDTKKMIMMK